MSNLNKEIDAQELNIQLGQIKMDEIKLTKFILTMIRVSPQDRKAKLERKLLM